VWEIVGSGPVASEVEQALERDSMNVDKPSTASATLTGTISVSGGDGSLSCTLEVGSGSDWADDQCSLHVHISVGGGHTYNASW